MTVDDDPELELEADALADRVRAGEVHEEQLRLRAWLGDPAAYLASGCGSDPRLEVWLRQLPDPHPRVLTRAALAALRAGELVERVPAGERLPFEAARDALTRWLECPCGSCFWAIPERKPLLQQARKGREWARALAEAAGLLHGDVDVLVALGGAAALRVGPTGVRTAIRDALWPLATAPVPRWSEAIAEPDDSPPLEPTPSAAAAVLLSRIGAGELPRARLWLAGYLGDTFAQEAVRRLEPACCWFDDVPDDEDDDDEALDLIGLWDRTYRGRCYGCWAAQGDLEVRDVRAWILHLRRRRELVDDPRAPRWSALARRACEDLLGPGSVARALRLPAAQSFEDGGPLFEGALNLAHYASGTCGPDAVRLAIRDAVLPEVLR